VNVAARPYSGSAESAGTEQPRVERSGTLVQDAWIKEPRQGRKLLFGKRIEFDERCLSPLPGLFLP
jgi:hypothetical protein